jgi:GNAT superfamily N-acetyltransferase
VGNDNNGDAVSIGCLERTHNLKTFTCENARIDNYLRNNAWKDHKAYKVRIFVATRPDSMDVIGYYSLTLTALVPSEVSTEAEGKFNVNAVPAIYLPKLGVHADLQGKGIGSLLMQDAFERALLISEHAGAYAITLDPLDDEVAKFYRGLSFEPFEQGDLKMFLPLKVLRAAVNAAPA